MKKVAFAISCIILLASCQSVIDKKKAEEIIKEAFVLPRIETRTFYSGEYDFIGSWPDIRLPGESYLENNGYRKIDIINQYTVQNGWVLQNRSVVNIQFTDNAQPFIVSSTLYNSKKEYQIKVADLSFGEIIELRKISDTEYEVVFNLKRTITPMYEAFKLGQWNFYNMHYMLRDKDIESMRMIIIKNEDGWHVSKDAVIGFDKVFDPEKYASKRE